MIAPLEYAWRKERENRRKGWELRLDLVSGDGEVRGCFSITRSYTTRTLRSDIDCFTAEFADALCSALQRASESHVASIGIAAMAANRADEIASVA
jgi:hypothetical protein